MQRFVSVHPSQVHVYSAKMSSANNNLTGYGNSMSATRRHIFDPDKDDYELWEVKFKALLRLNKLYATLDEVPTAATQAAYDVKNAEIFAALVMWLDDKSIQLIMRDALDDGKAALGILKNHYLGASKPRVISLYCELTSLKMAAGEDVTAYCLRAETAATRLKSVNEAVSDSLLSAMVLKGLPESFSAFTTFISQQDPANLDFSKFKTALRNFEENEKTREAHLNPGDNVSKVGVNTKQRKSIRCYNCQLLGHTKANCKNPRSKYCKICRNTTHDTADCGKKSSTKAAAYNKTDDKQQFGGPSNEYLFNINSEEEGGQENCCSLNKFDGDGLLVDCGATTHILRDRSKFFKVTEEYGPTGHTIELADASKHDNIVTCRGDARIILHDTNGRECNVILSNALCIPTFKQDFISVSALTNKGVKVNFDKNHAEMITVDGTKFKIEQRGKLYYVNSVNYSNVAKIDSLENWHHTLGHCNVQDVLKLEKVVDGMVISEKQNFDCSTCFMGKMVETRNHKADVKATKPLELIHTDLSGCVTPTSYDNSKYCMNFIDDYSGLTVVYFLKNKSDATAAAAKFIASMAPYGEIKRLRCDNGTEYTASCFKDLLINNKIKQEFSAPFSSHQNGTAERGWKTCFDMARCVLIDTGLPKYLWPYATRHATYVRNRCYNPRLNMTPIEAFTGRRPNLHNLERFGATCFAYVQKPKKLDDRAREGKFLGMDPQSPAHIVYFPDTKEIKRIRTVKFFKHLPKTGNLSENDGDDVCFPFPINNSANVPGVFTDTNATVPGGSPPVPAPPAHVDVQTNVPGGSGGVGGATTPGATACNDAISFEPRRNPSRDRKKPAKYDDYITSDSSIDDYMDCVTSVSDCVYKVSDIPLNYKQAVSSPQGVKWQAAMETELAALKDNHTFDLVPRKDHETITGRWVFAKKMDSENKEVFRARFVAKGFQQTYDVNFGETFSPTAKITTIRLLVDLAVQQNLLIHQLDACSAYLQAEINYEIYLEQPEGFKEESNNGKDLIWKLNKGLYGLKQSGRLWNETLDKFLIKIGFERSSADHCLYVKNQNNTKAFVLVFVDDLLIISSDINEINNVKSDLSAEFKMKNFGQVSYFLGIEFVFSENSIKMHQSKFIEKILEKFGMADCKPKLIPCDVNIPKIDESDSETLNDSEKRRYQEIVGSLIYLMTGTRPDISYVVNKLSQRMSGPTNADRNLAKSVLRYLAGTITQGLQYAKHDQPIQLVCYSDSDWGSSDDRRSITGYCCMLSERSTLISWCSKKQKTVSLSSCESEYYAICNTVCESLFLQQILSMILPTDIGPTLIFADNRGTIDLARNPVHHKRSKHISIKFHFIREHINSGNIILQYIPSNDNIADIFTHAVSRGKLLKFELVQ